jgi:hypothetical protein
MKRLLLLAGGPALLIFIAGSLLSPSTWQWDTNNLRVQIHNIGNERKHVGSIEESCSWSKLTFFAWGTFEGGSRGEERGKPLVIESSSDFHIAQISPNGVTVRVRYQQKLNETSTSFDKLIFVPAHAKARVDVSPDIYITGAFE